MIARGAVMRGVPVRDEEPQKRDWTDEIGAQKQGQLMLVAFPEAVWANVQSIARRTGQDPIQVLVRALKEYDDKTRGG